MKINSLILKLLKNQNITYVDVGAANNLDSRWARFSKFLNYIGFEPDKRSEINEPNKKYANKKIIRSAVWDSTKKINLNLARKPELSSFYKPNTNLVNLFSDSQRFDIVDNINLDSVKIDDIEIVNCDFIKLDIQGGELKVLEGSVNKLKNCFGLQVEVEFVSVYLNQPLFSDVSDFLKKHDFVFMDFINITRWERDNSYSGLGQCTFGDALFLKTPESILNSNHFNSKILSRYLSVLLIYNRFDLIQVIYEKLDKNLKDSFNNIFIKIEYLRKQQKRSIKFNLFINRVLKYLFGKNYKSHLTY